MIRITISKELKQFNALNPDKIDEAYEKWLDFAKPIFDKTCLNNPRESIESLSNKIVDIFKEIELLDKYDVYQVLMTYWLEVMSDDFYSLYSTGSWVDSNEIEVFYKEQKKKKNEEEAKLKEVGWQGKLIPKELVIEKYFSNYENIVLNEMNRLLLQVFVLVLCL